MKAIQLVILFTIFSCALATADESEISALFNIRNHVPGLDTQWTDERLLRVCGDYVPYIFCRGNHIAQMCVT